MSLSKKILTISHIAGNIMTSISVITTIEAEEAVASSDFLGGRWREAKQKQICFACGVRKWKAILMKEVQQRSKELDFDLL